MLCGRDQAGAKAGEGSRASSLGQASQAKTRKDDVRRTRGRGESKAEPEAQGHKADIQEELLEVQLEDVYGRVGEAQVKAWSRSGVADEEGPGSSKAGVGRQEAEESSRRVAASLDWANRGQAPSGLQVHPRPQAPGSHIRRRTSSSHAQQGPTASVSSPTHDSERRRLGKK